MCGYSEGASDRGPERDTYMYAGEIFLRQHGIVADRHRYFNTGVVVFRQGVRALLSPESVAANMALFSGPFAVEQVGRGRRLGLCSSAGLPPASPVGVGRPWSFAGPSRLLHDAIALMSVSELGACATRL